MVAHKTFEVIIMNKQDFAALARQEYADPKNAVRRGGVNGHPYWNGFATQFMFCPSFEFAAVEGCTDYLFVAEDVKGNKFEFHAEETGALLTPVWDDLAPGKVKLTVYVAATNEVVGEKEFTKSEPFADNYEVLTAEDFRNAARKAYDYVFKLPYVQSYAIDGTPGDYVLNFYITKMIGAIIPAMINYTKLSPENAETAMKIATNAADFLISLTNPDDSPLAGIPPTYYNPAGKIDFGEGYDEAVKRQNENMIIYPAHAGAAYVELYKVTNDKKYLDAAVKVAMYYKKNVLENGSWYNLVSNETGKPVAPNFSVPNKIAPFLYSIYELTGEEAYKTLSENAFAFIIENCLKNFNWEGQFEDSRMSVNYSNLTHFISDALIADITKSHSGDKESVETAKELMRYVEDQFVVWKFPESDEDKKEWYAPCGLEQYACYVPIDSSTAAISGAFTNLYKLTKEPLYLKKAHVLATSIVKNQDKETGYIPTFWHGFPVYWVNCQIGSANRLFAFADYLDKIAAEQK